MEDPQLRILNRGSSIEDPLLRILHRESSIEDPQGSSIEDPQLGILKDPSGRLVPFCFGLPAREGRHLRGRGRPYWNHNGTQTSVGGSEVSVALTGHRKDPANR